jgi:hypothetical protein
MTGIALVAAFAIDATPKPPVAAITATPRRTKSGANSGRLSGLFSAHRYYRYILALNVSDFLQTLAEAA